MGDSITVGLLFGGQSVEHEVSLQSMQNIVDAMEPIGMDPVLIAVDKQGRWHLCENDAFLENPQDPEKISLSSNICNQVILLPWNSGNQIIRVTDGKVCGKVDVIFPVLHGPYGEDGTIQGHLKLSQIPFVGCGVLSSALAMDKGISKKLLAQARIPHAAGECLHRGEFSRERIAKLVSDLGLPLFVKPANLGSSVGISHVGGLQELEEALETAFQFDHRVIVEEEVRGQEVECAVLGNERPRTSVVGEIIPRKDFYSYAAKYLDPDGAELLIPARISNKQAACVRELAQTVFQLFNCRGMARVDFFVTSEQIVVNEINTIPGFTKISMYPRLWEATGVSYSKLIKSLVELAFENSAIDRQLRTSL